MTPTCAAEVRPLLAAPRTDWVPSLHSGRGSLCRHRPRVRVAQHHRAPRHGADWVEQGVAALSARCNRTSPIKGIRLRHTVDRRVGGPPVFPGWRPGHAYKRVSAVRGSGAPRRYGKHLPRQSDRKGADGWRPSTRLAGRILAAPQAHARRTAGGEDGRIGRRPPGAPPPARARDRWRSAGGGATVRPCPCRPRSRRRARVQRNAAPD